MTFYTTTFFVNIQTDYIIVFQYFSLFSQSVGDQLQNCSQRRITLRSKAADLNELCRQQISSSVLAVEQKIAVVMRDIVGQLGSVVDGYEAEFDEKSTENYKNGLFVYIDGKLEQELAQVGSAALSELHNEAPRYLIGERSVCVVLSTCTPIPFSFCGCHTSVSYIMSISVYIPHFSPNIFPVVCPGNSGITLN